MHSVVSFPGSLPVVAGVDGSRTGRATVDLAAAEAARRRARLLIVHVRPERPGGGPGARGGLPSDISGRHLLDVSVSRARRVAPGLPVDAELLDGAAATVLAGCSEQARLLVVGHRDEVVTRSAWGATATYLARHSACPLYVHHGAAAGRGPVVVAVSARPTATSTVTYAYRHAERVNARLVAVHVWQRSAADDRSPAVLVGDYAAERREAERVLAEALAGRCTEFPDVVVERLAVHELEAGYTIRRAAHRGRLLIAGIGRAGRCTELLAGALGDGPRPRASCPVLLVPPAWREQVPAGRDARPGRPPWSPA